MINDDDVKIKVFAVVVFAEKDHDIFSSRVHFFTDNNAKRVGIAALNRGKVDWLPKKDGFFNHKVRVSAVPENVFDDAKKLITRAKNDESKDGKYPPPPPALFEG